LDDLTYLKKIRTIIATTEYDDISKGLVICGNNDIGEYECKAIKRMAWNFRDHDYNINKPDTTSSNWSTIFDTADIVYLHEGWEAFVCKYAYDNITDCKLLNEEETYDGFNSTFLKPELLIVQPKTPEVLQEAYGDIPYALVYDEPNFNGNHVLVYADSSEDIKMYPNPIKYPRSVFNNHKGLNLYLNIGDIVKNTTLGSGSSLYDITNDKFINSTDSTPWEIESNISGTIVTYTNEKFGVHNDGMKIIYSNGIPITRYTGDVFLGYHNSFIKSISLSEGWEAYICNDVERNNCLHYDTEGELKISLVAIWGNYFTIEYMKIQPKNHATFNRFYGHREYNGNQQEYGNGLIGYVELYENIDYTGRKEIIIGSGKFKIGEDTFLKPRDVKRVKVVGGVNLTGSYGGFDPQGNWVSNEIETFLGSNIPIYHYNTFLNSITVPYSNQPSIITHAEMSANARSVAKGLYSYTPAGIVKNYYTSEDVSPESTKRKSEENFWKENEEQNKIMDNADFVYYAAHGAWDSDGGSQAVLDSFSFVSSYSKEGKSMGDYETEWMLTSACNSLGKYKCIECEDVIDGYLVTLTGEDECRHIPPTHDDCSRSIKTTEKDALEVYDDIFANGLHGFAGMYTVSKWIGTYYGESSNFWKKIKNGSSVAYSWTSSFGSYVPERNAGYIAPGPCRKYLKNGEMIYSYIHNDHFWGYGAIYGGTRPDPNKEFIKNEGFCYYSYNNGDQNGDYDFSQINPSSSDWLVLNQDEDNSFVKDSLSSNIVNYFNVKPDNVFIGDSLVSFGIENRNDFLTIESDVSVSIHDASMKDDNLVYSLKHNADIFYDNNVKSIVDKYGYEILNVNLSMIVDRHYDTDENPDKEINASEVIFSYNLSKNGNPFLEENYVKIGVNPKTGEILSVSTKISPIEESGEKIDYQKIDSDYNELVIQDGEVYLKAYCLINNQYRPAIYRVDVSDIEVVKVY
jgi:hypothetical protein